MQNKKSDLLRNNFRVMFGYFRARPVQKKVSDMVYRSTFFWTGRSRKCTKMAGNYFSTGLNSESGLVLFEFVIIVAIFVCLISISSYYYTKFQKSYRDFQRKQDISVLKKLNQDIFASTGKYIGDCGRGPIVLLWTPLNHPGFQQCFWHDKLDKLTKKIDDPLSDGVPKQDDGYYYYYGQGYRYYSSNGGIVTTRDPKDFVFCTKLESKQDIDYKNIVDYSESRAKVFFPGYEVRVNYCLGN